MEIKNYLYLIIILLYIIIKYRIIHLALLIMQNLKKDRIIP